MQEFKEGGSVEALMRTLDWRTTEVGEPDAWPQSLRTAVAIAIGNRFPSYVVWGATYTQFYNDAYIPIIGMANHPAAFGQSARDTWRDYWDETGPMFERVMTEGTSIAYDNFPMATGRSESVVERYFSFSLSPVRDDRNRIGGIFVTCMENTERVHSERYLIAEREKMRKIFTQAPVGICVHEGPEHTYVLCNETFHALTGNKRDLIGKGVREAFPEVSELGYFQLLDQVYATGQPYIGREAPSRVTLEDGSTKNGLVDFLMQPRVDDAGRIHGVVTVCTDVTAQVRDRKAVEDMAAQLQRAVAARDKFLSVASHELKTPITSLKLQLQGLRRQLVATEIPAERADRWRRALSTSDRQVDRLIALVEDLLDVARIQAGRMEYRFTPVNVAEMIDEVVETYGEQLENADNSIAVDVEPDLTGVWDRARIEQVLTNLLSNACKYAPATHIRITARTSGTSVELRVQDGGKGIAEDRQSRIFDRFERATTSRNISGLGLGLFIVANIVHGHSGHVRLESDAEGACFIIMLPMDCRAVNRA